MFSLLSVDGLLLLAYGIGLLYLGLRHRDSQDHTERYLLGGRRLTLVPFVATLVSTWYGGILGIGEFTYRYGIVNWIVFGLPYYIFALIYAIYLAPAIRESDDLSIPDRLRRHYGYRSAKLGALLIFLQSTPAPYLLMLAILAKLMLGTSILQGLLIGALVSTVYLWRGGFESVVRTDLLQAILMFAGFGMILVFLTAELSPVAMWQQLPVGHRSILGEGGMSLQTIIVWFFIASWTFVDPGFYQRCSAASDGPTARRGILISVGVWFLFDLMTTLTGLYAVVNLPMLSGAVGAFPELAFATLPPGFRGFFLVSLLAIIMSTIDSLTFISGTTLGRDLAQAPQAASVEQQRIRYGMTLSVVLGLFMALLIPSVIELWFTLGMILVPGLLVPILVTFKSSWRLTDAEAFAISLAGIGASSAWFIWAKWRAIMFSESLGNPLNLEPMIPGLFITVVMAWYYLRGTKAGKGVVGREERP